MRFRAPKDRGSPTSNSAPSLVASHAAVQVGGGSRASLYPLVFVVVAFLASFSRQPMGLVLVGLAVALEVGVHLVTEDRLDLRELGLHAAFLVCFGVMSLLFTRAEIARVRERSRRELDDEKENLKTQARMFRLVAAPSAEGQRDEDRLVRSASRSCITKSSTCSSSCSARSGFTPACF
ncbi:MAG: hypothetical protein R3B99_11900 [Polyangiales bacterium]